MTKKQSKKALWFITKETNKLIRKLNNITKENEAVLFKRASSLSSYMVEIAHSLPYEENKKFSVNCHTKLINLYNKLGRRQTLAHFKCEAM